MQEENEDMMFICRQDAKGYCTVLEATPETILALILCSTSKASNEAKNTILVSLVNGAKVYGQLGVTWYRVQRPVHPTLVPTHCRLTGAPMGTTAFNGRTKYGGWCFMSSRGWLEHGCGELGPDHGEKYRRDSDDRFYLSEGMCQSLVRYEPEGLCSG